MPGLMPIDEHRFLVQTRQIPIEGGPTMVRNEHEIVINCPTEQVFRFVTDLDTWRQWHPSAQEVEKTTPGPVDVGTIWKVTGQVQGRPMGITIEVAQYETNRQFGFTTTSGPIQARQAFAFVPVADGTRLTTVIELADPELARAARQQWESDLLTLKELLEAQTEGNP
jgi:uncharacterized protein YndB with AHSA1/START domain